MIYHADSCYLIIPEGRHARGLGVMDYELSRVFTDTIDDQQLGDAVVWALDSSNRLISEARLDFVSEGLEMNGFSSIGELETRSEIVSVEANGRQVTARWCRRRGRSWLSENSFPSASVQIDQFIAIGAAIRDVFEQGREW